MKKVFLLAILTICAINCLLAQKRLAPQSATYTAPPERSSSSSGCECCGYYGQAWDKAYKKHKELCAKYPNFTTDQMSAFNEEYHEIWYVYYKKEFEKAEKLAEECEARRRETEKAKQQQIKQEQQQQAQQKRQEEERKQQAQKKSQQQQQAQQEARNKEIQEHNRQVAAENARRRREAVEEAARQDEERRQAKIEQRNKNIVEPGERRVNNTTGMAQNAVNRNQEQAKYLGINTLEQRANPNRDVQQTSINPELLAFNQPKNNSNENNNNTTNSYSNTTNNSPIYDAVVHKGPNYKVEEDRNLQPNEPCVLEVFINGKWETVKQYNNKEACKKALEDDERQRVQKNNELNQNLANKFESFSEQTNIKQVAAEMGKQLEKVSVDVSGPIKVYRISKIPVQTQNNIGSDNLQSSNSQKNDKETARDVSPAPQPKLQSQVPEQQKLETPSNKKTNKEIE